MRLDRFTEKAQEALQEAAELARATGNQAVEPEHLLLSLVREDEGVARALLEHAGASFQALQPALISAIERCGKQPTWACTITEPEKTKNVETGIMAPISFGPGVRFSNQKLQIMQSEFSTLSFKPVN